MSQGLDLIGGAESRSKRANLVGHFATDDRTPKEDGLADELRRRLPDRRGGTLQLAEFVSEFTPSPEMRDEIMTRLVINEPTDADTDRQRRTLKERRKRLRDLYEMGDIEKAAYRGQVR